MKRFRELVIVATAPWALLAEEPVDVDCNTQPDGGCIAASCRLHDSVSGEPEAVHD